MWEKPDFPKTRRSPAEHIHGHPRPGKARSSLRLLHVFPTFAVGGAQIRFALLANALGSKFEHVVVSLDGSTDTERLVRQSVRLRLRAVPAHRGSGLSLTNLQNSRKVVREERPDLLLTYNWGAVEWALAARFRPLCPHLHAVDGFGPEEAWGQLRRRVWLRRLALSGRTTVVVPSQTLRELAITIWRLDPSKINLIPNGVDAGALASQARQPLRLRHRPDERLFGTLAGLRPEKNLERLLRIAAMLPDAIPWRLVIAGEGAERARLEAHALELGLAERIVFTGFVDRPGALLGELDVFVLTSDTEQMPLGVLEAMAVGLPVLATDVGDLRLMLPPTSADACLFRRDAEPAFAARLATLLGAPEECRTLGALNRENVADFTLELMVARYERLWRGLIAAE